MGWGALETSFPSLQNHHRFKVQRALRWCLEAREQELTFLDVALAGLEGMLQVEQPRVVEDLVVKSGVRVL